jgi:hypothetical protein
VKLAIWVGDKQPEKLGIPLSLPATHWLIGGSLAYTLATLQLMFVGGFCYNYYYIIAVP